MAPKVLPQMRSALRNSRLFVLASALKRGIKEAGKLDTRVVSLRSDGSSRGSVLLSYINDAFFLKPGEPVPNVHTNRWASLQMAKTFLDLGYCVDVISWQNSRFLPRKHYSILVDVRHNLERLAPFLNDDCIKIMHIDTAHILFHNAAEAARLLALQQRKGVTLPPRRFEVPNLGIEHADCGTTSGSKFTIDTFKYANKTIYRLPVPAAVECPWPDGKDWEACRRRFLWFGSSGFVHKGLDQVLDAFVGMPEYHLTVCGPIHRERDFVHAYFRELYETPNIETVGWVEAGGPRFMEITRRCVGLVYTSCSEGGGAGAITCLHAGLIPIVSYEASVDVHDFGYVLKACTTEEIQNVVRTVASLPEGELRQMSRRAWEFARANHTRAKFAQEYRRVISEIVGDHRER